MGLGVTLERVQFQFASIIGELRSEPDILSQFAVWVDLRLAEYKLKGSISLDCSGHTPDPVWLKGIVATLLKRQLAKQKSSVQSYLPPRPSPTYTESPASRAQRSVVSQSHGVIDEEVIAVNERLRSPDIVSPRNHSNVQPMEVRLSPDIVIKEEPSDDGIYPISLHVHRHDSKECRKRTAAETIMSEIDLGSHSQQPHSLKLRRLDPNSADDSLRSIIGLGDHSQDAFALSVETINSDCDFILAIEVAQNANEEMAQMGGNSSMQLTQQRVSGTAEASSSNLSGKSIRDPSTGSLAEERHGTKDSPSGRSSPSSWSPTSTSSGSHSGSYSSERLASHSLPTKASVKQTPNSALSSSPKMGSDKVNSLTKVVEKNHHVPALEVSLQRIPADLKTVSLHLEPVKSQNSPKASLKAGSVNNLTTNPVPNGTVKSTLNSTLITPTSSPSPLATPSVNAVHQSSPRNCASPVNRANPKAVSATPVLSPTTAITTVPSASSRDFPSMVTRSPPSLTKCSTPPGRSPSESPTSSSSVSPLKPIFPPTGSKSHPVTGKITSPASRSTARSSLQVTKSFPSMSTISLSPSKRSSNSTPGKSKKTKKKRKVIPCKDREFDANIHCGVKRYVDLRPCTRSLTCKMHALSLRRAVGGRRKPFDELLKEHRAAKHALLQQKTASKQAASAVLSWMDTTWARGDNPGHLTVAREFSVSTPYL